MWLLLRAGMLAHQNQSFEVLGRAEEGEAYAVQYIVHTGKAAKGAAVRICAADGAKLVTVEMDTYLRGRRAHVRGPDGALLAVITKAEPPLRQHQDEVGKLMKEWAKASEEVFSAVAPDGRPQYLARRHYPHLEVSVHLRNMDGAEVATVSRGSLVDALESAVPEGPDVIPEAMMPMSDWLYFMKCDVGSRPATHIALLLVLAALMEEAHFGPHVAFPPKQPPPPRAVVDYKPFRPTLATPEVVDPKDGSFTQGPDHPPPPLPLPLSTEEIVANARRLMDFLEEVDNNPWLYRPQVASNAVKRYERYWLPLLAKHCAQPNAPPLAAPLDVAWAWLAHSLAPVKYAKDFRSLTNCRATSVPFSPFHRSPEALVAAKRQWHAAYPSEPFNPPPDVPIRDSAYQRRSSYNILAAMMRQQAFPYQVRLPHWREDWFLVRAAGRYCRFLHLVATHPKAYLVPTYDIDLMWHTHQAQHATYARDTKAWAGGLLDHDDSVDSRESGGKLDRYFQATQQLWEEKYGEDYTVDGGLFRGPPPSSMAERDPASQQPHTCREAQSFELRPREDSASSSSSPPPLRPFYSLEDVPKDGILVGLSARNQSAAGPHYDMWLRHAGPRSQSASVHVFDGRGEVAATAKLIGAEQLPVLPSDGWHDKHRYPALTAGVVERAFLVCNGSQDWGVVVARWEHWHAAVPPEWDADRYGLVAVKGKPSVPGQMSVRLYRLVNGVWERHTHTAHEWGKQATSWQFRHSKGKSGLGKILASRPKRDIAVELGARTLVSVEAQQDAACCLAFVGALSLLGMLLGLEKAAFSRKEFSMGLLAAHGVQMPLSVRADHERLPRKLLNSRNHRLGQVGGYQRLPSLFRLDPTYYPFRAGFFGGSFYGDPYTSSIILAPFYAAACGGGLAGSCAASGRAPCSYVGAADA